MLSQMMRAVVLAALGALTIVLVALAVSVLLLAASVLVVALLAACVLYPKEVRQLAAAGARGIGQVLDRLEALVRAMGEIIAEMARAAQAMSQSPEDKTDDVKK